MTSEAILIRAQEPEDAAALTEVLNQPRVVWGTMQTPYVSVAARQARAAARGAGRTDLVAVTQSKVVGWIGLSRFEGRRAHAGAFGMAVHDDHTGRGVGTALMRAIVDQADLWLGLKRLEITVWTDNAAAIALYERFGFEREGVLRAYGWRDGAYADALAMARLRI